jgi:hypothetical protein
MRAATETCKEHGQHEITVECGDVSYLEPGLKSLLQWIEKETEKGRRFLPEQTVQFGWSILEIRQRTDGTIGLFEPDFRSMPARFVDSVTNTLFHLLLQKWVAESLGLEEELEIPQLQASAIICTEFGVTDGFVISRVEPQAADSGWFFGCNNESHDHQNANNLRRVSLYEAAIRYQDKIIPFLGLPPDIFVGIGGDVPYFSRGEKELSIRPGSYLHGKYVERRD